MVLARLVSISSLLQRACRRLVASGVACLAFLAALFFARSLSERDLLIAV